MPQMCRNYYCQEKINRVAKNDANQFKKVVKKVYLQAQADLPTLITHLDMGIHRLNGSSQCQCYGIETYELCCF